MTDVLAPVFIPYARFLEVRARRLDIVTELRQRNKQRTTNVAGSQVAEESGARVARWGNADYSVVLYRSSYASGFRMIVTSVRLDALARTAEAKAARLDERDAPRRELARQKKEADETRAAQEKARLANKAGFRP